MTVIEKHLLTSPKPFWFHGRSIMPLQKRHVEIESGIVLVGYTNNVGVCMALLSTQSILQVDTGVYGDYSLYQQHGLTMLPGLGFDEASTVVAYQHSSVADFGLVLGDLLASPRPHTFCNHKTKRGQGNVYVPDYVRILGELHDPPERS